MRLAVVGSRTFQDFDRMCRILDQLEFTHLVSGGAQGADSLAQQYAKKYGIPITIWYPNWTKYGKSAGYRRNERIVLDCDEVIAFQRAQSKGTQHAIDLARKHDKPVRVFPFK